MDELKDIYDRITYLRHKGMKMKDIAALVGFPPGRALGTVYNGYTGVHEEQGQGNGRR